MNVLRCFATLCAAGLTLSACGESSVKDTLGISRKAPDEFRVVSRPPLSVPPQFNLRPPSYDGASPTDSPAHKQAEALITGNNAATESQPNDFILQSGTADTAVVPVSTTSLGSTSAESQFLMNAGADKSDPTVRNKLVEEKVHTIQQEEEAAWWDVLSTQPEKKDPTVKAKEEAERIKKNKDEGKPVTEGETPEVGGRDTGILGRILGY